jgi:hypothetical protein
MNGSPKTTHLAFLSNKELFNVFGATGNGPPFQFHDRKI